MDALKHLHRKRRQTIDSSQHILYAPYQSTKNPYEQARSVAAQIVVVVVAALAVLCSIATAYDICQQLIGSDRRSEVGDLTITLAVYVVSIISSALITFYRRLTIKSMLQAIPRAYMPLQEYDSSKVAHELLTSEYDRACVIKHISQPRGRQQPGWGRPGTPYEHIHFRSAILSTVDVLNNALDLDESVKSSKSRAEPISPLTRAKDIRPCPIPQALFPLVDLYEQILTKSQYGLEEPTETDWETTAKVVAVFVGLLGLQRTTA